MGRGWGEPLGRTSGYGQLPVSAICFLVEEKPVVAAAVAGGLVAVWMAGHYDVLKSNGMRLSLVE